MFFATPQPASNMPLSRSARRPAATARLPRSTATDIFVGGANDHRNAIVSAYAARHAARHPDRRTVYFRQTQGRKLTRFLRSAAQAGPVSLTAHSWGVPTACWALAQAEARVDVFVGVDPVGRNPLRLLPEACDLPSVEQLIHVQATGRATRIEDGNLIASIGRRFCGGNPAAFETDTAQIIQAPYPHSHFAPLFEHAETGETSAADAVRRVGR